MPSQPADQQKYCSCLQLQQHTEPLQQLQPPGQLKPPQQPGWQTHQRQLPQSAQLPKPEQPPGHMQDSESSNVEAFKLRILQASRIIVTVEESLQVVEEIMSAGQPIGLDLEGVNLGPKGELTLVQVATMAGQVSLFDVQTNPALLSSQGCGLASLLSSENIVKVVHDCKNDSVALYRQYGVTITNVFDTQAAHAVLWLQETGQPVDKVGNVSLNALCELYSAPVNPLKSFVKNIYRLDERFWARRPLTSDMVCHAAADVLALVPTIYNAMTKDIKPEFRDLFHALCEENQLMYIQRELVKRRKRQRKKETERADLKLKLATMDFKEIVLSGKEMGLLSDLTLSEVEEEKIKKLHKDGVKLERIKNSDSKLDSE